MELSVSTAPGAAFTLVRVAGELDMATAPQLRSQVDQVIDGGTRQLLLDLDGVTFVDSVALSALIMIYRRLYGLEGRVCVASPRPTVASVLKVTGLDRLFDVYGTVQDALASFHG